MASTSVPERIETIRRLIHDSIVKFPELRKVSFQRRQQFIMDLALVAVALRAGYLVDNIAISEQESVFSDLISALRLASFFTTIHDTFSHVVHVYEPTSEQSFFLNIPISVERLGIWTDCTSFVSLAPDPSTLSLMHKPPFSTTLALESLLEDLIVQVPPPPSIPIKSCSLLKTAVPLAAILLEYPVAYTPETLESPFLCNVPLDVYECVVSFGETTTHTLLKFSCPSELANQHPDALGQPYIKRLLKERYLARIHRFKSEITFQIVHTTEQLDRVAL
ncbi:hypothetical protein H0H93_012768 [Arthromyces matolae]|nr:hypothetical protein H0H93_012768 [Arthromyces matolae]